MDCEVYKGKSALQWTQERRGSSDMRSNGGAISSLKFGRSRAGAETARTAARKPFTLLRLRRLSLGFDCSSGTQSFRPEHAQCGTWSSALLTTDFKDLQRRRRSPTVT